MRRLLRAVSVCISVIVLASVGISAQAGKGKMARVMWSAFICGTYAEISEEKAEQKRLFEVGIRAGREFLGALLENKISDSEYSKEVPVGVTLVLGGPSIDFMIGRVFAAASKDAWEKTMEEIDTLDNIGGELRKIKAENLFFKSNCSIIE